MIAKRIAARIHPEDARYQCRASAACHRKNGHSGRCQPLAVVLVEKVARWVRRLAS